MVNNVSQHWIPKSYLQPWRIGDDSRSVRLFDCVAGLADVRFARGQFQIDDLYTRVYADGQRDLAIENGLAALENQFGLLKPSVEAKQTLSGNEAGWLLAFASAMHARTPAAAAHDRSQFEKILRVVEDMEGSVAALSPEARAKFIKSQPPRLSTGRALGAEDIRKIVDQPLQTLLLPRLFGTLKQIGELNMTMTILASPPEQPFITSDNPCFYFDPAIRTARDLLHFEGLKSPTCELDLPISPTRFLVVSHYTGGNQYIDLTDIQAAEMNRRIVVNAKDYFVARQEVADQRWFSPIALWP